MILGIEDILWWKFDSNPSHQNATCGASLSVLMFVAVVQFFVYNPESCRAKFMENVGVK